MRRDRDVDDWGQTAVLGKGRNGIKEHICIKKAQMREERKRRSDKRKASTKEANKENPKGGINHCPTYPSFLPFYPLLKGLGPCFLILSPSTPFPPPPPCHSHLLHLSIHPSFHPYICPSICPLKTTVTLSCLSLIVRPKKTQKNTVLYASICENLHNMSCKCPDIRQLWLNLQHRLFKKEKQRKNQRTCSIIFKNLNVQTQVYPPLPSPAGHVVFFLLCSAHKRIPL